MIDYLTFDYLKNGNEVQIEIYNLISDIKVGEYLKEYSPTLVGTFPIDINITSSDLDIICDVKNFKNFEEDINKITCDYNKSVMICQAKESHIYNFKYLGYDIEIFAQNEKVCNQNAYKHMIIEKKILDKLGVDFKLEIIRLKELGFKTEHAFCELLGIEGDVYEELLKVNIYDKLK